MGSWFACGPKTFATACQFARPPGGSDPIEDLFLDPAHEGFYFCAFAESVTLPGGRYDYGGPWESFAGGTSTRKNIS